MSSNRSQLSLTNMTAGEVSPKVDARVDSPKYASMLRQCLNMIPYRVGPLTRRPGTQYMGAGKLTNTTGHDYSVRVQSFTFSPKTTFMLEFGHQYIRFYSNGQRVSVTVESLPSWVNTTAYAPGQYVQYLGIAYYNILATPAQVPPAQNPTPLLDTASWVAQTILEQPTPYNADGGVLGLNAWISTQGYNVGDLVQFGAAAYVCVVLVGQAAVGFSNANPTVDTSHWDPTTVPVGNIYNTDIWNLAFCQINDVMYICHPDYPVYGLTRVSDVNWVMKVVNFFTPPLLDQNATNTTITPSAVSGNAITLTASAPAWATARYYEIGNSVLNAGQLYNCIVPHLSGATFAIGLSQGYWLAVNLFQSTHVGSTWQIAQLRPSAYIEYTGTAAGGFADGTSSTIKCLGNWEVHSYGVWSSDIAIQRSLDGGQTWDTVRSVTGRNDRNVDITGKAIRTGLYRIVVSNSAGPGTPGTTDPRIVFECVDALLYGLVTITSYTSALQVAGNVVQELASTAATEYWSEAAWSDYRGYPQAVASYQQRVIYGASGFEPQRIWGTVTNDIENFYLGDQSNATDSFAFDLNAPSRGPIEWLIGQTDLFAGFSGAEWVINSGSTSQSGQASGAAIGPTNINAVEQSTWGSADGVAPCIAGDALLFTQRQGTSLRQMLFDIYHTKYMSQDLTALSEHLFSAGIVQLAYMTRWRKQSLIWGVTKQGLLVGMTYELQQDIAGWHRHTTGGGQFTENRVPITADAGFESVAVIDGKGQNDDEVWVVTNRLINGTSTRYIERMNPVNWEEVFTGAPNPPAPDLPQAFYVDCGMSLVSPGGVISGLTYLEGRIIYGLADGIAFGPITVAGGIVNMPDSIPVDVALVQIGLPIPYAGQPMRIDQDPRAGNTQGCVKTISDLYVRVWNSIGGYVSNGTMQYPLWVSGTIYNPTDVVQDQNNQRLYTCVAGNSGTLSPPNDSASWVDTPLPVFNYPVPIPYTNTPSTPYAVPTLVTVPTDIRITPMLMPSIDMDPQFIISGNDANPLTVLALIVRYSINYD